MKLSSCPFCRQTNFKLIFRLGGRFIRRCRLCGLVMVNPLPTKEEIRRIYEEDYFNWQDRTSAVCIGYWAYLAERELLLEYFSYWVRQLGLPQSILDVGCGHGFFLEAAKKFGVKAVGIDLSKPAVAYAKEHGGQAYLTDIEHAPFKKNSFDAVVAFQLIEHVVDPLTFLKKAYVLLKPAGILLLATPNEGGYLRKFLGKHWLSFRHREHLYFFSLPTLTAAARQAGFSQITSRPDITRYYPIKHLLGGAKFYFKAKIFQRLIDLAGNLFKFFGLLELQIPVPLDNLIVIARKT